MPDCVLLSFARVKFHPIVDTLRFTRYIASMAEAAAVIRGLRQNQGLTQEDLALRAGLKFSFVRSVESGRNLLKAYDKREAFAKGLNIPLSELAKLLDAQ